MKKLTVFILSLAVLLCSSCGQQVVSNDVPQGGNGDSAVTGDNADNNTDSDGEADFVIGGSEDMDDIDEDDEYSEDGEEAEEEVEPEYDYDAVAVAEKAAALNVTAEALRNEIGAYLQTAAANGYGMLPGTEGTFLSIYIEEGLWTVSVDDTDCFAYVEDEEEEIIMEWFGYGEADSTTSTADAEDPDTLFAIALVNSFPEIQNGSVGAWIQDGSCLAAYFTEDSTAGDGQMDIMLGTGGWIESYCEWDGYNQGMSDEENVVGTSPVLPIGGLEE